MSVSRFSAYSESNWGKSSLWPCSNPAMRRDLSTIETCRQEEKDLGFGAPATWAISCGVESLCNSSVL